MYRGGGGGGGFFFFFFSGYFTEVITQFHATVIHRWKKEALASMEAAHKKEIGQLKEQIKLFANKLVTSDSVQGHDFSLPLQTLDEVEQLEEALADPAVKQSLVCSFFMVMLLKVLLIWVFCLFRFDSCRSTHMAIIAPARSGSCPSSLAMIWPVNFRGPGNDAP